MENPLIKTNDYDVRYVALRSFEDHTVVGVGDDPETDLEDARANGIDAPVLLYVERAGSVQIY